MTTDRPLTPLEAMERERTRLLEEAADVERKMAEYHREMAEYHRISAKYGLAAKAAPTPPPNPAPRISAASVEPPPTPELSFPEPKSRIERPVRAHPYSMDKLIPKEGLESAGRSLADLVAIYYKHPRYHNVRFVTRTTYKRMIDRLVNEIGNWKVADLGAPEIQRLFEGWSSEGRNAQGLQIISMLRILANFGATELSDADCDRLSLTLHRLRFDRPKQRSEVMTYAHATGIIQAAHKMLYPSIALAQALQFDCQLKQRDVIGEWVPLSEPGETDLSDGNEKWLRGIRWEEIDSDYMLSHVISRSLKRKEINLRDKPLVMAELKRIGTLPKSGPVIINEFSGSPYRAWQFRRIWRQAADAAGVPFEVKNIDSKPSARNADVAERVRRATDSDEEPQEAVH